MQSKGALALWAGATAIVVGGLTLGILALVDGDSPAAPIVLVDEPVDPELDGLGAENAQESPTAAPPAEVTSVLAADVGFYSVEAYSLTRMRDLSMSVEKGDVLVTDGVYQAVLGSEILDAREVYAVEVQDEPADELGDGPSSAAQASWTVYTRFNDAAALKAATSDLGCRESPDNMIAMVRGGELLRLVALPASFCGEGFARGQILWWTFYGDDDVTSAVAEKQARGLAATLLGEEAE